MKKNFVLLLLILIPFIQMESCADQKQEADKLQPMPFGSIKPLGWIKDQMQKDVNGFVGNLDRLVPDLINDPIYGSGRLAKHSKAKDLGNLKEGDAAGDEQYKWWNSETQSNWWDGYVRNVLLINDSIGVQKVNNYVRRILETQDADGYLGIYDTELRYKFQSENGELWAKTTLLRGLLAYYEFTNDQNVWNAIVKAVDNVMLNYPINQSNPFFAGKDFSGGVAHGLTFTDVCDRMYQITKNKKYREYATFLFRNFSENYSSEKDIQLHSIFDATYKLQCHGVHTFEHLRPLIVAAYSSNEVELRKALSIYLNRLKQVTTITGGAIGDEWIAGRSAHSTHTGYEYCSLHELLDSYALLFQKSGEIEMTEMIERIFYNAAQGARNPNYSAIAYLKTDNSFEMLGTKNGEIEPDRKQTRYKYSPVHQDVAVCCSPNAGRITPYFVQNMWFKENDNTLVAALLGPNKLETTIRNTKVEIEEITEYPYQNKFQFKIKAEKPIEFTLKIRKPVWATSIRTNEKYRLENGFVVISKEFKSIDNFEIEFLTEVKILEDQNGEKAFAYGALLYALPIEAIEQKGKKYAENFDDVYYKPVNFAEFYFHTSCTPIFQNGIIGVSMKNKGTNQIEEVKLIPFSKTILRQVSFKQN